MLQLLYVSGAARPMSDTDIADILETSKRNNPQAGITGVLLWADGMFIQFLEGEAGALKALARRIKSDPRHRHFMVLLERDAPERLFPVWSMGFKRLDVSQAPDEALFQISRAALSERASGHDDGLVLDAIMAFSRDFLPVALSKPRKALA